MGDVRGKAAINRSAAHGSQSNGGKYAKFGSKGSQTTVRWAQVSGPLIKDAIGFVTSRGDAITFGRTTDGGALSVTILSGSERLKQYATSHEEAEELLMQVIEDSSPTAP